MIDPDTVPELVALDRIFSARGLTLTAGPAPGGEIACSYEFSSASDTGGLGWDIEAAALPLVAQAGGFIVSHASAGGFEAVFGGEEEGLAFLKAFSAAVSALVNPPAPPPIRKTGEGGFVLGGNKGLGFGV